MALSISAIVTIVLGLFITYLFMIPQHYQCEKCKLKWTARFKADTYCYTCKQQGKKISKKEYLNNYRNI